MGGPCDYSVTPSPIGLWIFFSLGLGLRLGLGGQGLGLGLDNNLIIQNVPWRGSYCWSPHFFIFLLAKLSSEVLLESLYGDFLRVRKLTDARAISRVRAVQLVANLKGRTTSILWTNKYKRILITYLTIFARNTDSTAGIDTAFTCFPSFSITLKICCL